MNHRTRNIITASIGVLLGLALIAVAMVPLTVTATGSDKIGVCHATSSANNPYVYIEVDDNATYGGHGDHEDDKIGISSEAECTVPEPTVVVTPEPTVLVPTEVPPTVIVTPEPTMAPTETPTVVATPTVEKTPGATVPAEIQTPVVVPPIVKTPGPTMPAIPQTPDAVPPDSSVVETPVVAPPQITGTEPTRNMQETPIVNTTDTTVAPDDGMETVTQLPDTGTGPHGQSSIGIVAFVLASLLTIASALVARKWGTA